MSGGTQASAAGSLIEPGFAWREGRVATERGARRIARFEVEGRGRQAVSVGSSEHFALPRFHPGLREVDVYLGWFGPASRAMQALSAGLGVATMVPGTRALLGGVMGKLVKGSTGGPDAETRARSGSHVVAIASDAAGQPLAEARVAGVDGYTFTARILAWGATRAAEGAIGGAGALGPVEAFGLVELERGCADAGLRRVPR
jgi:hypothetical protein